MTTKSGRSFEAGICGSRLDCGCLRGRPRTSKILQVNAYCCRGDHDYYDDKMMKMRTMIVGTSAQQNIGGFYNEPNVADNVVGRTNGDVGNKMRKMR